MNEYLDFNFTASMQADSAGRALSSIITKMIKNKGLPYTVYSMLHQTCVSSISQYGSEVFGFSNYESYFKLHLRSARSFLGLPKTVTSFGLVSEIDWLLPQYETQIRMVRYLDRLYRTSCNRLLAKVYTWDRKLNDNGVLNTWSTEVKQILDNNNLGSIYDRKTIFPLKSTIAKLRSSMYNQQKDLVKAECMNKPKLRTFITFKDFDKISPHIGKPLSYIQRKTLSKLRLGILPLRIETARYQRPVVPLEQRLCYCNSGAIESEQHLLFQCNKYDSIRQQWLEKLNIPHNFNDIPAEEQLKLVLNISENVRPTAQFVIDVMDIRSILNKDY